MVKMLRSEKQLTQSVVDVATAHGWLVYHTYDSRRSEPGFPDLVMLKGSRMLVVELKSLGAKPTAAQNAWLSAFRSVERIAVEIVDERNLADLYNLLFKNEVEDV